MAYQQEMSLAQPPNLVKQVAQLIRLFSRQEKVHLLKLVPELKIIPVGEDSPVEKISAEQHELANYFQQKRDAQPIVQREQSPVQILGGRTFDDFFALDEAEQAHLWDEAHAKAAKK